MGVSLVLIFVIILIFGGIAIIGFTLYLVSRNSKKRQEESGYQNTANGYPYNNMPSYQNYSTEVKSSESTSSAQVICNKCGYKNSEHWSFCPNCGSKKDDMTANTEAGKKCVVCHKEFPQDRFFCDECGSRLE